MMSLSVFDIARHKSLYKDCSIVDTDTRAGRLIQRESISEYNYR